MRPRYKFIVSKHTSITSIEDKANRLLLDYDDVDIQSMLLLSDGIIVVFKVKLQEIDELQDWGT